MSKSNHIDSVLKRWPYDPDTVNVRITSGADKRKILQMRIDLGLLQLEMSGRPDGLQPEGYETYLDYLLAEAVRQGEDFELDEAQCDEVDREFIQFYHRRICWLKLQEYGRAVEDANHTLSLMDFCAAHSSNEPWTLSHEQYRPFVLFHRAQASALHALEDGGADSAIGELNAGLDDLREVFEDHELDEYFEENELVLRLTEFRESLRDQFNIDRTLSERLADAIANEQYELAAQLRDEIAQTQRGMN